MDNVFSLKSSAHGHGQRLGRELPSDTSHITDRLISSKNCFDVPLKYRSDEESTKHKISSNTSVLNARRPVTVVIITWLMSIGKPSCFVWFLDASALILQWLYFKVCSVWPIVSSASSCLYRTFWFRELWTQFRRWTTPLYLREPNCNPQQQQEAKMCHQTEKKGGSGIIARSKSLHIFMRRCTSVCLSVCAYSHLRSFRLLWR